MFRYRVSERGMPEQLNSEFVTFFIVPLDEGDQTWSKVTPRLKGEGS